MKTKDAQSQGVVEAVVDYLEESGRSNLLGEVIHELGNVAEKASGAGEIQITSAVKLSEKDIEALKQSLPAEISRELPVVTEINKALLGGFTVRAGDWFLDASLSRELSNLKRTLLT